MSRADRLRPWYAEITAKLQRERKAGYTWGWINAALHAAATDPAYLDPWKGVLNR